MSTLQVLEHMTITIDLLMGPKSEQEEEGILAEQKLQDQVHMIHQNL